MNLLIFNASQLLQCKPENGLFKTGSELNDVNLLNNHSVIIEDGIITDITDNINQTDFFKFDQVIDASQMCVLPGLIDSHTHIIFAGNRADEFELRTRGYTYEQIAALGGGITNTVTATRNASKSELLELAKKRLALTIQNGVTSIEIKSGYGLDFDTEIKMLEVIQELKKSEAIDIIPTFLGAHTFPKEYANSHNDYIELIINKVLPYVAENNLAVFCDIFVEKSAFNIQEAEQILNKASELGLKIKLHCDQFNSIGGVDLGIKLQAKSLDHLEVTEEEDIFKLKNKDIVCTLLPGVSYFLNIPYSPARKMIDNGLIIALATDFNPGSCTTLSLPLVMNIAATQMKMSVNEIINSVTINPAYALGLEKITGSIEVGKQADLLLLDSPNYKNLVYYFGINQTKYTIKKGEIIYERNN